MLNEVLAGLAVAPGGLWIDGTSGGGGHAEAILSASAPGGRLLGLDADPAAIDRVANRLATFGARATLVQSNFRYFRLVATKNGFSDVNGVLLDLGLSSFQLAEAERGFAFSTEGPLDMRFDPTQGESAADLVNHLDEQVLADLIYRYGEEPRSRRIAAALVAARPLRTTGELAAVVERAVGRHGRIHPATQTFQALRIAVNDELVALEEVLPQAIEILRPGGRLAVITFHSLEDRIVKNFMRREAQDCICPPDLQGLPVTPDQCTCGHKATVRLVNRKAIAPSEDEVARNPRSRSAKLRVAEKLAINS